MKDLLLFLVLAAIGYFVGSKLRSYQNLTRWSGHVQTAAIMILIFTMGLRMGSNEEVIGNLSSIGLISAALAVIVMAASAVSAFVIRKCIGMDHFARMKDETATADPTGPVNEQAAEAESVQQDASQKITAALILVSVVTGLLAGYILGAKAAPDTTTWIIGYAGIIVNVGLSVLLFLTGVNIGVDGTVAESFKKVGFKILLFPFAAIFSALLAAATFALLFGQNLQETLAECAGFGWYTIASAIIMDRGLVSCAAIAFMHNLLREYFTLLSVPILSKKIGYMETISMAGGTAMGVCLPVIAKSTRSDVTVYSFLSGLIQAASVPILIPLVLGLS